MPKKLNRYEYKNASMAKEVLDLVDAFHGEMKSLTGLNGSGIKKADIYMAALKQIVTATNEEQLKMLRDVGVNC